MRLRAAKKSRIVLELRPDESKFPGMALPEFKLKKILVPVDFSEASRKALHYAVSFARQFGAELLLLHILEPLPMAADPMGGLSGFNPVPTGEAAARKLAQWRNELAPNAPVRMSVKPGRARREILRTAEENNIDLIILGRRGHTGWSRLLAGGTAGGVLRGAPCPVLVVREREHDFIEETEGQSAWKPNDDGFRGSKHMKPIQTT
jgi:universal stress protein A